MEVKLRLKIGYATGKKGPNENTGEIIKIGYEFNRANFLKKYKPTKEQIEKSIEKEVEIRNEVVKRFSDLCEYVKSIEGLIFEAAFTNGDEDFVEGSDAKDGKCNKL